MVVADTYYYIYIQFTERERGDLQYSSNWKTISDSILIREWLLSSGEAMGARVASRHPAVHRREKVNYCFANM